MSIIPVKIEGFSPGTYLLAAILVALIGGLIRAWPALKKIASDGDSSLRKDLLDRVKVVETELHEERLKCAVMEKDLRAEIAGLHGQIHELRNTMVELTLAAGLSNRRRARSKANTVTPK